MVVEMFAVLTTNSLFDVTAVADADTAVNAKLFMVTVSAADMVIAGVILAIVRLLVAYATVDVAVMDAAPVASASDA